MANLFIAWYLASRRDPGVRSCRQVYSKRRAKLLVWDSCHRSECPCLDLVVLGLEPWALNMLNMHSIALGSLKSVLFLDTERAGGYPERWLSLLFFQRTKVQFLTPT